MIAARIGPIGKLKLPSADAVVAEAVGSEISCAAVVVSKSAGSLLVVLAAERRVAPRDWRLTAAAAVSVNGSAARPLPVPVDDRDTAARAAITFADPAGADLATTGLLPIDADGAGPE